MTGSHSSAYSRYPPGTITQVERRGSDPVRTFPELAMEGRRVGALSWTLHI